MHVKPLRDAENYVAALAETYDLQNYSPEEVGKIVWVEAFRLYKVN
jgi:hypothetical protein